jgi:hypothetical protein
MNRPGSFILVIGLVLLAQTAQAGWTPAQRLTWTSGYFGWSEDPTVAADSNNAIHVVWADYAPGNFELYYKRSTDGGTSWSPAQRLTWNENESEDPAMAIDSNDTIHVVWKDQTPGNNELYYKRSTDGGRLVPLKG